MADADQSRIEALRRARRRRPWTVELVVECASDPVAFKDRMPACAACPEPCETGEVCATAVAKSEMLFESMGREQAYHLVENGMKRLRARDDAAFRTVDRERPNTFLRLDAEGLEGTESTDERQTKATEER
jgi:hypothetical protein